MDGVVEKDIDTTLQFDDNDPISLSSPHVEKIMFALMATIPSARCWSPESPALHTLRLEIDGDAIIERFGIRQVRAENEQIYLNDRHLKLLGYNRHEAHPQFGPALPMAGRALVRTLHPFMAAELG